jgi:hypothetical protein
MPRYLDEFGLTPADVDGLVEYLTRTKGESFGNIKRVGAADARAIYLSALEPRD